MPCHFHLGHIKSCFCFFTESGFAFDNAQVRAGEPDICTIFMSNTMCSDTQTNCCNAINDVIVKFCEMIKNSQLAVFFYYLRLHAVNGIHLCDVYV